MPSPSDRRAPTAPPRKKPKPGYRPIPKDALAVGDAVREGTRGLGWITKVRERYVEVQFAEGGHAVLDPKVASLVRAPEAPPAPKAKTALSPPPVAAITAVEVDADLLDALRDRFTVVRRTGGHVVKVGKRKVIDLARTSDGGYTATALSTPLHEGPKGDGRPTRRAQRRVDVLLQTYARTGEKLAFIGGLAQVAKDLASLKAIPAVKAGSKRQRRSQPWIHVVSGGLPSLGKRR
jgi:hypothetical protein